ncbi:class F sortase [Nocardioides sp.]|uniref:class F sortase n=1 Tax=Nocardioides sp. TaxID=35761 RepID=UPI002735F949|nr:class F sortase [Nocardioides sp.]MDP3894614.1 class F sortase [Nocardioides sp.]
MLGATLVAPGTAPAVAPAPAVAQEPACDSPEKAFRPAALKIPGVVARTRVLARGRDRHGVPRPPPLTERGKWRLAWDKASRIRPGGPRGVVRLTAHTYPRSAGPALGNRLLRRLNEGDRLVVSGPGGERLCYQVVKRVRVRAERKLRTYYSSTGRPRLAILVCSGKRRGPGDWSHRTIWYAVPTSD